MGIKALHHLCCQIWKQQEWPEDWKPQEFVMLYKNGNFKECGNYRTIALISLASKILLIIILNRMKCKVEDCQAGYRANRGTTDMLFVLQIIIEKIRDGNEEGYYHLYRLQQGV
ncbi:endonuclease-reverse transcriptase [Elysia marginata]|uniref:Endonuclease-reverse transcriptase n=1 Tax=Elysia marginata TaxID=1093978 RepID=A0AAV4GW02_9GAST|nr:endonuclease-reverse transcriptase [Elysia marginata]